MSAGSRWRRLLYPWERGPVGPFREGTFTSRLHDRRIASVLGLALAATFATCFATGLVSHLVQQPPPWFVWPSRPAGLYRLTQGIHVATGLASIPLLLAKLWTVYPRLWTWPPVESLAHAVERLMLPPLVGGSLFLLVGGLANTALWYPWPFFFPRAHYWAAWITIGALVTHVAAKAGVVRAALRRGHPPEPKGEGLSRRGFVTAVGAALGVVTVTTVGQTLRPLSALGLLAPRKPEVGPQGLPVNKSARAAGVEQLARDPAYRLAVEGAVRTPLSLSLDELRSLPQHEAVLPIACVEGWSAVGRWRGIRLRELLERAGAASDVEVTVESLQPRGLYRRAVVNPVHVRDDDTLLALELNGEPLRLDHGFPARLIGPNRPGVMQTKWVSKLVVRAP